MHLLRIILLSLLLLLFSLLSSLKKSHHNISSLRVRKLIMKRHSGAWLARDVQGKLSVIEIVGYSYSRWLFPIAFSKFKPLCQEKTQTPQSQKRP